MIRDIAIRNAHNRDTMTLDVIGQAPVYGYASIPEESINGDRQVLYNASIAALSKVIDDIWGEVYGEITNIIEAGGDPADVVNDISAKIYEEKAALKSKTVGLLQHRFLKYM